MTDTLLTDAEQKQLAKLLSKANAGNQGGPAVRIGDPYVALTNLSVPRRGDPDKQTDLVMAGDTLYLTPEEAANYLRHEEKDGRRISVIRKKSEVGSEGPPRAHPSLLSGPVFRPGTPAPGSDMPRPDPAGSSQVVNYGPPEASPPVPGSETIPPPDALDLAPGTRVSSAASAGADQDLMGAVKAQAGLTSSQRAKIPAGR